MLTCFSAIAGGKVDSENGIIRRVSVLTEGEAKGHPFAIDSTTLSQIKSQAEKHSDGLRVKVNHGSGVDAIAGVLKNFLIEGKQLYADLHLLKTGGLYAKLMEMAQKIPGAFGLSVSFENVPEKVGEEMFARSKDLYSCDMVDQPAANPNGLLSVPNLDRTTFTDTMITELKALWAKIGAGLVTLEGKTEATELTTVKTDLTALGEKITGELTQLTADLATAKISLASVSADKAKLEGEKTALEATHKTAMTNLEAQVADRASKRAQEIQAGLGSPAAPAVDAAAVAAPGAGKTGMARLLAASKTDLERAGYIRKN